MKKTLFSIKRKEIQKRIRRNDKVAKKDFFELLRRASRPQLG